MSHLAIALCLDGIYFCFFYALVFSNSTSMFLDKWLYVVATNLLSASTRLFPLLLTCSIFMVSKDTIISLNVVMYFFILGLLVLYTPFIWFVTSIELVLTFNFFLQLCLLIWIRLEILRTWPHCLLFRNRTVMHKLSHFPSRSVSMRLAPDPSILAASSVYNI